MKKIRIKSLYSLAAFSSLCAFFFPRGAEAQYSKGPYLTHTTYSGITVQWESYDACQGTVDYGTDLDYGSSVTEGGLSVGHRVRLEGLLPSTTYYYRVCCGGYCEGGSGYYFTTRVSPCENFDFVAYGDTRGATRFGDEFTRHRDVLAFIDNNFDPLLLLALGDYVYGGENTDMWQFWFESAQEFLIHLPFFPVIGNHDYEFQTYTGETNAGLINYAAWFDLPPGPDPTVHTTYYNFQYGSVMFVVMDGFKDFSPGSDQYVWLEDTLAGAQDDPDVLHTVMAVHQPPYGLTWFGPNSNLVNYAVPLAEAYGVKLFLAGHEHSYERVFKYGIQFVVVGNGGALLDGLLDILPVITCALVIHPDPDREALDTCHYGALQLEVRADTIFGSAYTIAGEMIDQFSVTGFSYKNPSCIPDVEMDDMEEVTEPVEEEETGEVDEEIPEPLLEPGEPEEGDEDTDAGELDAEVSAGCGCFIA